jgi:hypothetical protein
MSSTLRTSLRFLVAALLAAGALSACGGSSSESEQPAGTTTTAGGLPSTTTGGSATAAVSEAAAAKAAVQLNDVGSGFAPYRKAGGLSSVGAQSCSATAPGAVLTTADHVYSGPMFKKKDATYFAYSEVYVFRTEELARRYAAFRATPAFKQCKQRQDDATTRDAHPNIYVKLTPASYSNPTGHIPTMYRELTGNTSSGKQVANGYYDRYTVVSGPVVVVVSIDSELARDDAGSQALAQQTGDILRSLDTTLASRVSGA